MNKKHYVDLSDIKENDLDNTASFTDLMSRSEKLEHKRKKEEEQTRELKEILIKDLIIHYYLKLRNILVNMIQICN